ncbi:MAG: chloride channel protein, partial [Casimicrobiaceae bacterium]
ARYLRTAFAPRPWLRRAVHLAAALLVGVTCTLFAGFANATNVFALQWFARWPWLSLIVMPSTLLLCAYVTLRWFPFAAGSGIPQAIAALQTAEASWRRRLLSLPVAAAKVVLVLIALLGGAAVGREGPSVHVGASMMYALSRVKALRLDRDADGLILAGAGAGIASAFNTPLGGIVFALEEMSRHHPFRAHSATLVAVIGAGIASLLLVGKYTYFGVVHTMLPGRWAVQAVLATGIASGLAGGVFARAATSLQDVLPHRVREALVHHPLRSAALCGLLLALLALATGGATMGTGYAVTRALIDGTATDPGLGYAPARLLATYLCVLAGIPGGLFAPSLAIGAGLGAAMQVLLPGVPIGSLALLAMVGYLAAVTQSPITSFVITMEMTANQDLLLPMMAVSVIAFGISRTLCRAPIYDALAVGWMRPPVRAQQP